jgi:2-amino-4-hydroxy-6-hydroxymethyldihydropteridine diphosphokinase
MRTAVALGANLGDRLGNLRAARKAIVALANVKPPVLSSAIYETEPADCEPGAEKFLNAVVEFDYEGELTTLLEQLIRIEEALGRRRDHPKNVSRPIDIDLLYCGSRNIRHERLELPHPRMHLRKFVLQPLADIRPDMVVPGQRKTAGQLLTEFKRSRDVVRFKASW